MGPYFGDFILIGIEHFLDWTSTPRDDEVWTGPRWTPSGRRSGAGGQVGASVDAGVEDGGDGSVPRPVRCGRAIGPDWSRSAWAVAQFVSRASSACSWLAQFERNWSASDDGVAGSTV